MCGFIGFTANIENKEQAIKNMLNKIIHKGNSQNIFLNENITLGFKNFNENSNIQPMYNENKNLVIVFNGKIYNYKEIKKELLEKGYIFKTDTDTEVLINLYQEKKENMLEYLRGTFSFAIYDIKNNEIFAARDFFGVKPFYYSLIENNLIFGSEIKSFLEYPNFKKELNKLALENYLSFQYSVLDETFFKGVFKLKAGHYLKFKNGKIKIERYFDPQFNPENAKLQETIKNLDTVLKESIEIHKMEDSEIGSFLSSGVDSSYISAIFNGNKTFTVGFNNEKCKEIKYAKDFSEKVGIENISKTISSEEYWENLSKVQYYMEEPLADPSATALYFLSQLASQYTKVVLSGHGVDELFGGYNIYKEPFDISFLTILPKSIRKFMAKCVAWLPFSFKGKNLLIRASKDVEERFIGNNVFSKEERDTILKNPICEFSPKEITKPLYERVSNLDDVSKMQYIDINLWLVGDILLKLDKMCTANSLEIRVPFLDKEVFKIASKIKSDYRVNKQATKYIFRMVAKEYLPEIISSKKKLDFSVPIASWLKEDKYYNIVKEEFSSKYAQEFFEINKILEYLEKHKNGKVDYSRKIWTIYTFLIWYKKYFN